jgi:hypothetical protein
MYSTGYPHGLPGDTRTPVSLSGVPAGIQLSGGQYRLTTPNTNYNGIRWDRSVAIQAANVTFTNCLFVDDYHSATYMVSMSNAPHPGLSFTDCEFDGNGIWADTWGGSGRSGTAPVSSVRVYADARGSGYTMTRCLIRNLTHSIDTDSNCTYMDCYLTDPIQWFDELGRISHNDAVQFFGGGVENVLFSNCVIDNYNHTLGKTGNTAALQWGKFLGFGGGILHNVTIDGCYLNGGGYTSNGAGTVEDIGTWCDIQNVNITNNRFGLDCVYSATTNPSHDPRIAWTGNVYDSTGITNVYGQPTSVVAGQPIA